MVIVAGQNITSNGADKLIHLAFQEMRAMQTNNKC